MISDTSQALTHANTLLPPFKSAPNAANISIQIARHVSHELNVNVNNTCHRQTHANPNRPLHKHAHAEVRLTTLLLVIVKTKSPVIQATKSTILMPPAHAKPGYPAMLRLRFLTQPETFALIRTLRRTVPTKT